MASSGRNQARENSFFNWHIKDRFYSPLTPFLPFHFKVVWRPQTSFWKLLVPIESNMVLKAAVKYHCADLLGLFYPDFPWDILPFSLLFSFHFLLVFFFFFLVFLDLYHWKHMVFGRLDNSKIRTFARRKRMTKKFSTIVNLRL